MQDNNSFTLGTYKTQRDYEIAFKVIESCKSLTPEQMQIVKDRITGTYNDMNKNADIIAETKSIIDISKNYAGKTMGFEGLATGFITLDKQLMGIKEGDVVVLGAYTGLGKSTMAMYWGINFALQGANTLLFALEDSEYEVGTRFNRILSAVGKTYDDLVNLPAEFSLFPMNRKGEFFKNKFAIIPMIEAFVLTKRLNVVILDMLNDILDPIYDRDAEAFMVELKAMCDRQKIALVLTSRLREPKAVSQKAQFVEKHMPNEDAIYGKGLIKYLATKIITLAPVPEASRSAFLDKDVLQISCRVCKNRVGFTSKPNEIPVINFDQRENKLGMSDGGIMNFGTMGGNF